MVSVLIMPRSATMHAADREAFAQPVDHRHQSGDIGGVARPHLRAYRTPVAIDQHREDHLPQVRPMVFAIAVLTDALSAEAFEVEAGGVHEHQVKPAEQIAPMGEQLLFDQILCAARREWRHIILLLGGQCLTKPGHRPVQVVQVEVLAAADAIIVAPAICRQIRTAAHQAMQHGEERRAFYYEAMAALARKTRNHGLAASLLPQPLEQQGGADAAHRDRRSIATACGIKHHCLPHEAGT
jgi:hypothetical protein